MDGVRNKKVQGKLTLEEAVDRTIDEMPEDFHIREFLVGNRAEVKSMCLTEYNEAETMQMFKEEGREEGLAEGREEGIALGTVKRDEEKITEMLRRGKTVEEIVEFCNYPDEQVRRIADSVRVSS